MLAVLAATPAKIATPPVAWGSLAPFLFLLGGALLLLLLGALLPRRSRVGWHAIVTVVAAVGAVASSVPLWNDVQDSGAYSVVAGAYGVDGFSIFLTVVIATTVIIAALLTDGYLRREGLEGPEAYVLLLLSASGGVVMASADDLIVVFLGLEILSIAVYVLAGLHLRRIRSGEAAMKYFVLGAFSSAFFLYGIAMVYGATGSTNLIKINTFLAQNALTSNGLLLLGFALLLVGFGFKVSAVPFHFWTPDVYQGSPTPVVSYMATGVKAAGFAGLIRVFYLTFGNFGADWKPIVYAIAVLTLFVGAVLAVVQTNVKRMLAYSSINHAGFILVAVQANSEQGVAAVLFYLVAYTFMVAGTFGVLTVLGRRGDGHFRLSDFQGISRREPLLAFVLMVMLLAQAGTPLTAGFTAKFYVISAAVAAHSYVLALLAMLSAVISAFLYLRIVLTMYSAPDGEELPDGDTAPSRPRLRVPAAAALALVIAVVGTIGIGLVPDPVTKASQDAVPELVASPGR